MRTIAVLPVKRFDAAKQRLVADLGAPQPELAERMVGSVLDALATVGGLERILVVTQEPRAAALAQAAGAEVVEEPVVDGHSAAAALGVRRAIELGAERALLVPGDCPLLTAAEIEGFLARHTGPGVVIVPDRHGTGTNALLLCPPDTIGPSFGMGSRERHAAMAHAAEAPWTVDEVQGLLLDVDTAEDLAVLRGDATVP